MVFIVKVINGVKKIIPVTADVGAGNPVGSYLYLEKKSNPSGYLYCDGSTFDETKYPLLYAYLGSNVLPDWRELGAKGAEKNTTLIFDSTETDPSTGQAGTQNHDVFAQGEFKDDQVQEHTHNVDGTISYATNAQSGSTLGVRATSTNTNTTASTIISGRNGTVTRGKSRAVFIYIKATSGLSENAQDNVINTLNEQRSYSTEEHLTGKKWIDGKPIYSKTYQLTISSADQSFNHLISNLGLVTKIEGTVDVGGGTILPFGFISSAGSAYFSGFVDSTKLNIRTISGYANSTAYVTLEYTKTT